MTRDDLGVGIGAEPTVPATHRIGTLDSDGESSPAGNSTYGTPGVDATA